MNIVKQLTTYSDEFTYRGKKYKYFVEHESRNDTGFAGVIDVYCLDTKQAIVLNEKIDKLALSLFNTWYEMVNPRSYTPQELCEVLYKKLKDLYRGKPWVDLIGFGPEYYFEVNEGINDGGFMVDYYPGQVTDENDYDPIDGGTIMLLSNPTNEEIWQQAKYITSVAGMSIIDIQSPIDEINLECNLGK